jgi:hypothetical protein
MTLGGVLLLIHSSRIGQCVEGGRYWMNTGVGCYPIRSVHVISGQNYIRFYKL